MIKNLLMGIIVSGMVVTNSLHPTIMETWDTEPLQDLKTGVEYCCLHDNTGNNWLVEKRLKKNSKYLVVTDDMGTENIDDDEIVWCVKL